MTGYCELTCRGHGCSQGLTDVRWPKYLHTFTHSRHSVSGRWLYLWDSVTVHTFACKTLPVEFTTGRLRCLLCTEKWKKLRSEGLLARSQYSEGPATGHLDTGFSWFHCVYKQMLRWFPRFQVATTCFSCNPPDLNLLVTNFIFCTYVKWPLPPGDNPVAVNKYYYCYCYGCLLSQAFSSWYFSWTSGDPHRSGFKLHTAVLSILCVMFQV